MNGRILTAAEWRSQEYKAAMIDDLGRQMARLERDECDRLGVPYPVSGGTNFTGFETLASMSAVGAAVGPTASLLSLLTREAMESVAPNYLRFTGSRLWLRAYGTISTTAVVPTYNLQLVVGPTLANPLTSAQMIGQTGVITPAASTTGNLEWYLDVLVKVVVTGSSGSLLVTGSMWNDFVTAGTYVLTPFKNATPPTAVVMTGAGGLLVPLWFDLELIMGAATAGNTGTCLEYQLVSTN